MKRGHNVVKQRGMYVVKLTEINVIHATLLSHCSHILIQWSNLEKIKTVLLYIISWNYHGSMENRYLFNNGFNDV